MSENLLYNTTSNQRDKYVKRWFSINLSPCQTGKSSEN